MDTTRAYHAYAWYAQSQENIMNEDNEAHTPLADGTDYEVQIHPAVRGVMMGNDTYSTAHSITPRQGTPIVGCPSNIDARTMRGKALLVKAGSPGDYEIKDGLPLQIVVTHWLIMPDTQTDEKTGEVSEFVRVVLYDASGRTFRTSGAGAPACLLRLLQCYSRDEWKAGIPLVVYTRPSKRHRGATYHDIQIDLSGMGV